MRGLPVAFDVRGLQQRLVAQFAGRSNEANVLIRPGTEDPGLVSNKRATDLERVVADLLVVIRSTGGHGRRSPSELVGYVLGLEPLAGEEPTPRALELIRAALDDEVQADAAGRLTDVLTRR